MLYIDAVVCALLLTSDSPPWMYEDGILEMAPEMPAGGAVDMDDGAAGRTGADDGGDGGGDALAEPTVVRDRFVETWLWSDFHTTTAGYMFCDVRTHWLRSLWLVSCTTV